ncbi:MAG: ATP-binding protein [Candidatus Poribacteria bacterium]|nr:ATP-binding protein [Candidatus Poribacteria bacterium]MDE0502711.1 ATP-binding protein [Candidatus Poribacteria bacterium]
MPRYSIQNKIVLPFLVLFMAVLIVVPLITIALFDRTYNRQFSRETEGWLKVIKETGYVERPDQVQQAYGVEVMVFGASNALNFTSLDDLSDDGMVNLTTYMKLREARQKITESGDTLVSQNVVLDGIPYKVIYDSLAQGRLYCLLRPMDDIAVARRRLTWLMSGIAVVVISLVALTSNLVGRNLSNPIKNLVQFTRQVAAGKLDGQCNVKSDDEIGDLTTAFNQMTRDLRDSRNELIRAERLATAGRMAASFAHEIRNPLSSMRMLTQMLIQRKDVPPSKREQSMGYILEEIGRIDVIVKGFMDFARPTALELASHDLNDALEEVLNLMEANLNHHQITLVKKFDSELSPIRVDRDKLKQGFMNIMLNAIEAMAEGGTVEVETSRHEDRVQVDVLDTGFGIPAEDVEQLFEPFFTTKVQGSGLGLPNTKRIMEQHGGGVTIKSAEGEGTRVSFWLPLKPN